jgi:hypothetical protein
MLEEEVEFLVTQLVLFDSEKMEQFSFLAIQNVCSGKRQQGREGDNKDNILEVWSSVEQSQTVKLNLTMKKRLTIIVGFHLY